MKRLSGALYALIALGAVVAAVAQPADGSDGLHVPDPMADAAALVAGFDRLLQVDGHAAR